MSGPSQNDQTNPIRVIIGLHCVGKEEIVKNILQNNILKQKNKNENKSLKIF